MHAVPESAPSRHDTDSLRDRVRLYLQVVLAVDVASYASDVVSPLLLDDYVMPELPAFFVLLRHSVSAVLLAGWLLTRFAKPGRLVALALEAGVTVGLAWSFMNIAAAYTADVLPAYGPAFGLLGILLVLSVRAAIVPSPVLRTVAVGVASASALPLLAGGTFARFGPVMQEGLMFMAIAFVAVTAVTSHVVYGLRREVNRMSRLGQYVLERKLGEGGMGVVYRAHHGMLRRPTAVKLLPPKKAGAQAVERFEREVRLTARLTHPNTVTVFDYGRSPDGVFYYAMELLEGATLREVVTIGGAQPPARVARILADCAGALHEAHGIGLIHRDVKPANIILCTQGGRRDVAKLLDFGLVKEAHAETAGDAETAAALTGSHVIVGTPQYMAPEAVRSPDAVDARSDLYALGAVGYYLLTGQHVFEGRTVAEVCAHHLLTAPVPPGERLGRPVPRDLEGLVLRCLAKDPRERPSSAAELEERLRSLDDLGPWNADEWWEEYAPALDAQRRASRAETESGGGRTLAIDPMGRT